MIKKINLILDTHIDFKELLFKSFNIFTLKIFSSILGYIVILLITNRYGSNSYGQFVLVITLLSIFSILPKFGLDVSLIKIISEQKAIHKLKRISDIIKISLIVSAIFSIMVSLIILNTSNIIVDIIDKNYMEYLIDIVAILLPAIVIIQIIASIFQGLKKTAYFILISNILNQFIFLLLLVFDTYFQYKDIYTLYSISIFISLIIAILILKLDNKFYSLNITRIKINVKYIMDYSKPMLFISSVSMIFSWSDVLMLSSMATLEENGIYAVAYRLAMVTSIIMVSINSIAAPKFSELYKTQELERLKKLLKTTTNMTVIIGIPIVSSLILLSDFFMGLFGDEFKEGSSVLIILSIGQLFNMLSGSSGWFLQMTNNHYVLQKVLIIFALINIGLNYILIPKYEAEGAAIATMLTVSCINIIYIIVVKYKFDFWSIYIPRLFKNND